jgi:hypothetical protein
MDNQRENVEPVSVLLNSTGVKVEAAIYNLKCFYFHHEFVWFFFTDN